MKKIFKILIILVLCVIGFFATFYISNYFDREFFKDSNYDIKVDFEDNEWFILEDYNKHNIDDYSSVYPYKFSIDNKSVNDISMRIRLLEMDESDIDRRYLSYVLVKDFVIISKGSLNNIDNNVLYIGDKYKSGLSNYSLYIYVSEDELEGSIYKYKLDIDFIKNTGPGFQEDL